jgi:hypothetical protein
MRGPWIAFLVIGGLVLVVAVWLALLTLWDRYRAEDDA